MNHQPKVSVIIPCYNNEGCIESVIHQSYKNLEIIVINDGSKDKTPEILRSYAEKDKRIVCINQNNKGVSAARNKGLSSATGDYIAFMDSDDEMLPDGIAHLVSEMKEDVDLVLASHVENGFIPSIISKKLVYSKKNHWMHSLSAARRRPYSFGGSYTEKASLISIVSALTKA